MAKFRREGRRGLLRLIVVEALGAGNRKWAARPASLALRDFGHVCRVEIHMYRDCHPSVLSGQSRIHV